MAKAKVVIKTSENDGSVQDFLNGVEDEQRRADGFAVLEIFKRVTREEPKMWGASIVGFGNRTVYRSTGAPLDWLVTGFSPRKTSLTLYVLNNAPDQADLLEKLGKHKASGGCLHIKKLSEVDQNFLERLIASAVAKVTKVA